MSAYVYALFGEVWTGKPAHLLLDFLPSLNIFTNSFKGKVFDALNRCVLSDLGGVALKWLLYIFWLYPLSLDPFSGTSSYTHTWYLNGWMKSKIILQGLRHSFGWTVWDLKWELVIPAISRFSIFYLRKIQFPKTLLHPSSSFST